jgi:hypothetical protein
MERILALTTASGAPCCLARSWKLCRMPCTLTGRSLPACTSCRPAGSLPRTGTTARS